MTATKKKIKLPLPAALLCTTMNSRGVVCDRRVTHEGKRVNGTTFKVCFSCAKKIADLHEARPDLFDPIIFTKLRSS